MSHAGSTGIPSPSNKLLPLDCSQTIHVHRFRKLCIWWWENNDGLSGANYHTSGSSIMKVRIIFLSMLLVPYSGIIDDICNDGWNIIVICN